MHKNFIRWIVQYSDNFSFRFTGTINHEQIVYKHGSQSIPTDWHRLKDWIFFPLLLQRAIEGLNKENIYIIYQDAFSIEATRQNNDWKTFIHYIRGCDTKMNEDQVKEKILLDIYNNEEENYNEIIY